MSNSKLVTRDQKMKQLLVESGTRLFEVVPVLFPDHVLMEELVRIRKDRDVLLNQMMMRQWRDNGPIALMRALKGNNAEFQHCNCLICNGGNPLSRIRCRLWERFVWYMTNCGITWTVVTNQETDLTALGFDSNAIFPGIPTVVNELPMALFPAPPEFNPLTASIHLSPVSHIDLHLVFRRVGRFLAVTFGRKLWEQTRLTNEEIRKYDLLMARLRA